VDREFRRNLEAFGKPFAPASVATVTGMECKTDYPLVLHRQRYRTSVRSKDVIVYQVNDLRMDTGYRNAMLCDQSLWRGILPMLRDWLAGQETRCSVTEGALSFCNRTTSARWHHPQTLPPAVCDSTHECHRMVAAPYTVQEAAIHGG